MVDIQLDKYGPMISEKESGDAIYTEIRTHLKSKDSKVVIDFERISSMATFCAKQIFGRLYLELGPERFFENLSFKNVNDDLQIIIRMGIENALEENDSLAKTE